MTIREAKVINRETGWDVVDFDPIDLTVQEGLASAYSPGLVTLVDTLIDEDNEARFSLVWSDSLLPVQVVCPECNDDFPALDGYGDHVDSDDELILVCGCTGVED